MQGKNKITQRRKSSDSERLAFWKLHSVVLADSFYKGEEPEQESLFGKNEAKLRALKKYKLFFPNRWPRSRETKSIEFESELELAENKLISFYCQNF